MMASAVDAPTLPVNHPFDGHMRQGQAIFGVHYGDPQFMLNIPEPGKAPSPNPASMDWDFLNPTWISPTTPYLILLPYFNPFYGPLFKRLNYTEETLPVQISVLGGWRITPGLIQEWTVLERTLRSILQAMYDCSPGAVSDVMVPFAYPRRFGYHLTWRSRRTAVVVAMRSRNAFLPLMATLTMMMLVLSRSGNAWRDVVIANSGVCPQWFADLESSAVGDLSMRRVGGIIDLSLHEDLILTRRSKMEFLLDLVVGRLPVSLYFYWGFINDVPYFPVPKILEETKLVPDHREITYLNGLPGSVACSPWAIDSVSSTSMHSLRDSQPYEADLHTANANPPHADVGNQAGTFPSPEKHSGQKYGEDIYAFFRRRKELNEKRAEMENASMKARRLARETHAARGNPPGKKGARVFVWEEEAGFFIRRAINRDAAADMWSDYTPNQRVYDSFEDQWDLCTALAPAEEPEGGDDDDEDSETPYNNDIEEFPELPGVPTTLLPDDHLGEHSTADDLERSHDLTVNEPADEAPYEPYHDMNEIPYCRFGFTEPLGAVQYENKLRADHCCKTLGDEHWQLLQNPHNQHIPALLASISTATTLHDVAKELLDLRQEDADIFTPWTVNVARERFGDKLFYVIRPRGLPLEKHPLHILLPSAATALQIVRQGWGPELQEVAFHLLGRGVEFRLCIQDHVYSIPRPPRRERYTGLGFRPAGYKPSKVDYEVYEKLRDSFLQSPRGRAARFAGGIIGRLARQRVNDDVACLGPTADVFDTGVRFWDGQSSTAYWDDELTAQEIDLICGVYQVATGQHDAGTDDGMQKTNISWWPKPVAWYASGLSTGWWSPDCERWYQKRLGLIRNDQGVLMTQTEWKHKIRFVQKSRTVALANEKIATEFLAKY